MTEDKSGDEADMFELVPDENAAQMIERVENDAAAAFLIKQVKALPEKAQRDCFLSSAFGTSSSRIAARMEITPKKVRAYIEDAAYLLQKNPQIKAAYPEYYTLPMQKTLTAFKNTGRSIVEDAVIKREEFRKGRYLL